jgi:uncharacterized protein (TIGR00661 family)
MRIVYALSGEGRGHGSLAQAVLPALQAAGHVCKVVTYGQSLDQLRDYDVMPIRGIRHFYDRRGRLSLLRSTAGNLGVLFYYATQWRAVQRQLRAFAPDLCLVNFEPFIPLLLRRLGVPRLSFDNQHALLHLADPEPPGFRSSAWTTRTAIRCVAPGAHRYIVFTFANVRTDDPRVQVVPPVVNAAIRGITPTSGDHVLVYLKAPNPPLLARLRQTAQKYLVYGYNVATTDGNLTFRVYNPDMPAELGAARAVIGTAGMSLVSEAVWLQKPMFAVPLKGEFEQTVNALSIRARGFVDFAEEPTADDFARFFGRLDGYRRTLAAYRYDPDAALRTLVEVIASMERGNRSGHRS